MKLLLNLYYHCHHIIVLLLVQADGIPGSGLSSLALKKIKNLVQATLNRTARTPSLTYTVVPDELFWRFRRCCILHNVHRYICDDPFKQGCGVGVEESEGFST